MLDLPEEISAAQSINMDNEYFTLLIGDEEIQGTPVIEVNLITLLREVLGWASSNSEAWRMVRSGGLCISNEVVTPDTVDGSGTFFYAGSEFIIQFGKRKWRRIIFPRMKQFYNDDAREEWYSNA
jgi:tyrosyl-tRNA synthetase